MGSINVSTSFCLAIFKSVELAREEWSMAWKRLCSAVLVGVLTGALAGCGGSDEPPPPPPGKTLVGETETGMKLTVQTFFSPEKDPALSELDEWRAAGGYPEVDYHRVTADNSQGSIPDSRRPLTFAPDAQSIGAGRSVEARFSCDAIEFEWLPKQADQTARWNDIKRKLCTGEGTQPGGIAPGSRAVYYLVTDRGFGERGIRTMKVFGPRDTELT
jgi:hypothetical protein